MPEFPLISFRVNTSLVTTSSSFPSPHGLETGQTLTSFENSFSDTSQIEQFSPNQTLEQAIAFPNAEIIENMICEPGNLDWVCF